MLFKTSSILHFLFPYLLFYYTAIIQSDYLSLPHIVIIHLRESQSRYRLVSNRTFRPPMSKLRPVIIHIPGLLKTRLYQNLIDISSYPINN